MGPTADDPAPPERPQPPQIRVAYVPNRRPHPGSRRRARFSSGLSVLDFMKRTSFLSLDPASLAAIGPAAVTLAEAEGLPAHARSVSLRLG